MIVDIDIKQLGSLATELSVLLKECDEAELNVYNQLKDATINWQDGHSVVLEGKIKDEKKETQKFLAVLQNNQKVFQTVYDEYKAIGSKLYANLEKKEAIINAIDECVSRANEIIYDLDRAERSFYYYELGLINNQRSIMYNVRDELKSLKSKVEDLYKKIKSAEERISAKVAKLEDVKVGKVNFSFQ